MFRRFGSEVTIIQRGARLMMTEDEDVSDEVAAIFRDDGITILTLSTPVRVEPAGSGRLRLTVRTDDGERQLDGSHLLSAIGRIPNTEALAPEATGISLNDRGFIEVNEYLQTSPWHLCDGGRQGWTGVHPPLLRRLPHPGRQPHQATEGQHSRPDRSVHGLHRPAAWARRLDRARGQGARTRDPGGEAPDERRHPGHRDGRDARLREGCRRRGQRADPRLRGARQ